MKRHLRLRDSINESRFDDGSGAITLRVVTDDLASLCCELAMLVFGTTEQLSFSDPSGAKVAIRVSSARSSARKERWPQIELLSRDIEHILGYLLVWYRDGIAEVDHLDIELAGDDALGGDCTLVIRADQFRPPMSAAEIGQIIRKSQSS